MKKEWLIAHRGAQCDGRENTLAAFEATKNYPLGWVEFDLHKTVDNIAVCHHNANVNGVEIASHTFEQLKASDPELLTFDEVIEAMPDNIPFIVEIKAYGVAPLIFKQLKANPTWRAVSYKRSELKNLIKMGINKNRLMLHQKNPIFHIRHAKEDGLLGVTKSTYRLSPLFFWRAHKNGLYGYVFTVNSLWYAWLIRKLYPYVGICTNRPDLLQRLK
ncbi:MAG TPA: glycerophosphodiester phosphodiesterase [Patescibacteria group bacterium]|nr:glycerophosphodiester phosphodiesterase [Patescibacteria group bacterium]